MFYSAKNLNIFKGKTVIITGHTGFKGSWLSFWLKTLGAKVIGISFNIPTNPSLFKIIIGNQSIRSYKCDIKNLNKLRNIVLKHKPDFVFHLAAQALVKKSYLNPLLTWNSNLLGTVNILESLRHLKKNCVAVIVTSDKSYKNLEIKRGYTEEDQLGGYDPYSASKGAAEFAIRSFIKSFFNKKSKVKIGIARAGNVIGGGDLSDNRIIPDAFKCWSKNNKLLIRNPYSTRPWQFVLEPLFGYIFLAKNLDSKKYIGEVFNFGPKFKKHISTLSLIDKLNTYSIEFTKKNSYFFKKVKKNNFKESTLLQLDSSKANIKLNWQCVLSIDKTLMYCAEWYINYYTKKITKI